MDEYTLPEMLRVPLDETVLQIKMLDLGAVRDFLGSAVNPPDTIAVDNSLNMLRDMQAIDKNDGDKLTPLGYHLASLPVDPRIGKMIVFGAIFQCLDPILTIAASLSFRSPFCSPLDKRDEADERKRAFCDAESDSLTLLKAFNGWIAARNNGKGVEYSFLRTNFLSRVTLEMIDQMRCQFFELLISIGFVKEGSVPPSSTRFNKRRGRDRARGRGGKRLLYDPNAGDHNTNSQNIEMVKGVVAAGLYPQICIVDCSGREPIFKEKDGNVDLHPASVNYGATRFCGKLLVYHEKVKTTKVYMRDSNIISPYPVLLFGGTLRLYHQKGVIVVDDWIAFKASPKVATLMKLLRKEMDALLRIKIEMPDADVSVSGKHLISAVSSLLSTQAPPPPKAVLELRQKRVGGSGFGANKQFSDDWKCPSCGFNCFANRSKCFKCGKEKPNI